MLRFPTTLRHVHSPRRGATGQAGKEYISIIGRHRPASIDQHATARATQSLWSPTMTRSLDETKNTATSNDYMPSPMNIVLIKAWTDFRARIK